jgi:hypothetical protein
MGGRFWKPGLKPRFQPRELPHACRCALEGRETSVQETRGYPRTEAGCFPGLTARFCSHWTLWALTMAAINPGKRFSTSEQRDVFCISTPRRSPRIKPASRRALKCRERVDLGMVLSLTFRKFEQFCEQPEPAIWAKMATRTGSESAWRMDSTVTSSIEG